MNTYCKKMNVFSIGKVSSMAVRRRLAKKYAGFMILHLEALSIFRSSELKLYLASFMAKMSKRRLMWAIRKTGKTMLTTKRT